MLNKDYMHYTFAYFIVWSTLIFTRMEIEEERQTDKQTETEIERGRQT